MQWLVAPIVVAVGVDLDHQRETLHPLLRGEVSAQTVDCDEDLPARQRRKRMKKFKTCCLEECCHSLAQTLSHQNLCANSNMWTRSWSLNNVALGNEIFLFVFEKCSF